MLITSDPCEIVPLFKNSGVFAYPTEAVYGLGCNPDDPIAIKKLLAIKERPANKGLILIASNFSQVEKYLKPLNASQKEFTLPSSTTYLFPVLNSTSEWLTGDFDSLAIRITKHPLVRELCEILDSAVVSTSANLTGQKPAKTAQEVANQLSDQLDGILDGSLGYLQKTTQICDSLTGEIIRS